MYKLAELMEKTILQDWAQKYLGIPFALFKGIKALLYALFVFIDVDINVFRTLFLLIILDLLSGIMKTWVIKGKKFKFKRFWSGIIAKLVLIIVPSVVALVLKVFTDEYRYFLDGTIKLVILTEGISVITNGMSVYKRKEYDNPDYLYVLMKTIRSYFDRQFQKLVDKNDEDK